MSTTIPPIDTTEMWNVIAIFSVIVLSFVFLFAYVEWKRPKASADRKTIEARR